MLHNVVSLDMRSGIAHTWLVCLSFSFPYIQNCVDLRLLLYALGKMNIFFYGFKWQILKLYLCLRFLVPSASHLFILHCMWEVPGIQLSFYRQVLFGHQYKIYCLVICPWSPDNLFLVWHWKCMSLWHTFPPQLVISEMDAALQAMKTEYGLSEKPFALRGRQGNSKTMV